jgi:hypothetical protein
MRYNKRAEMTQKRFLEEYGDTLIKNPNPDGKDKIKVKSLPSGSEEQKGFFTRMFERWKKEETEEEKEEKSKAKQKKALESLRPSSKADFKSFYQNLTGDPSTVLNEDAVKEFAKAHFDNAVDAWVKNPPKNAPAKPSVADIAKHWRDRALLEGRHKEIKHISKKASHVDVDLMLAKLRKVFPKARPKTHPKVRRDETLHEINLHGVGRGVEHILMYMNDLEIIFNPRQTTMPWTLTLYPDIFMDDQEMAAPDTISAVGRTFDEALNKFYQALIKAQAHMMRKISSIKKAGPLSKWRMMSDAKREQEILKVVKSVWKGAVLDSSAKSGTRSRLHEFETFYRLRGASRMLEYDLYTDLMVAFNARRNVWEAQAWDKRGEWMDVTGVGKDPQTAIMALVKEIQKIEMDLLKQEEEDSWDQPEIIFEEDEDGGFRY